MEISPPPSQKLTTTSQPGLEGASLLSGIAACMYHFTKITHLILTSIYFSVSQSPPFTDSRESTGSPSSLQPSSRSAVVARKSTVNITTMPQHMHTCIIAVQKKFMIGF